MKAILFQNRELETGEVPVWKILITALNLQDKSKQINNNNNKPHCETL